MFDVAGLSMFPKENIKILGYLLGLCNSKLSKYFLEVLSPTLNYETGHISRIPIIFDKIVEKKINNIVDENISLSKSDWDSFETSWDFQTHPLLASSALDMAGLITAKQPTLAERYEQFKAVCKDRFNSLQDNEEDLNRIFIDIYGLQDELTPEESDKNVTVHRVFDTKDDVP